MFVFYLLRKILRNVCSISAHPPIKTLGVPPATAKAYFQSEIPQRV